MKYKINVAKRIGVGTGYGGADQYRFLCRVLDDDKERISEVLQDFRVIYPYPEYTISCHVSVERMATFTEEDGFDHIDWSELL